MRPEVRDAINNINRVMQEIKYIDVSDFRDNVIDKTLKNKDEDIVAEVWEHLNLIYKEIFKKRNVGTDKEFTERYYYIGDKEYEDIDEFKNDFMIFD